MQHDLLFRFVNSDTTRLMHFVFNPNTSVFASPKRCKTMSVLGLLACTQGRRSGMTYFPVTLKM